MGLYAQDEWRVNKSPEAHIGAAWRTQLQSGLPDQLLGVAIVGLQHPAGGEPAHARHTVQLRHRCQSAPDFPLHRPDQLVATIGICLVAGGSDKTVVRGGFGIFYDALPAVIGDQFMLNLPGLVEERIPNAQWADLSPTGAQAQAAASAAAIMSGFANGATFDSLHNQLGAAFRTPVIRSQAGTFHTPSYQQWSFGIQQALGDRSSLSLGYVGNHGIHVPVYNEGLNAFGAGYSPFPATVPIHLRSCAGVLQRRRVELQRLDGVLQPAADLWFHGPGQLHLESCGGRGIQQRRSFDSVQQFQCDVQCNAVQRAVPDQSHVSALQQLRQRRLRHSQLVQRELRLADALQVRQQVHERRTGRMDALAELLCAFGIALHCHRRQCDHPQLHSAQSAGAGFRPGARELCQRLQQVPGIQPIRHRNRCVSQPDT